MSDINPAWPAKLVYNAVCKQRGVDPEKGWVDKQFNRLGRYQQKTWRIERIRRYLLEQFCDPVEVEAKLSEIAASRL